MGGVFQRKHEHSGILLSGPHAGLRRVEKTVELASSVSPMSLARAVKLESAEFPQQRPQAKRRPRLRLPEFSLQIASWAYSKAK